MKKLLQIILITSLVGLMFSSCGSQMSVTKRRYNNGYYVSHTAGKHATKKQIEDIGLKPGKAEKTQAGKTAIAEQKAAVPEQDHLIAESVIRKANELGQEQYKKQKAVEERKHEFVYNTYADHIDKIVRISGRPQLKESIEKKMRSGDPAGDVLSLFWIVLLVILLLYLFGLLFDGFGLGWAIHLLALVFLILLILWLLRVV
jgi:Flp pilus assembly protein TadB